MGDALLFGGGSSAGGVRQKPITKEAYLNLSESDRNNPYIVWIITNADATDFTNVYGTEIVVKALCWEAYCNLADEDRLDAGTVWIISDKTPEELAALSIDTSSGAKFYNIAGVPSSTEWSKVQGVDYALSTESTNPIANMAVAEKINELESALGGLRFSVTEEGVLRITYDNQKE